MTGGGPQELVVMVGLQGGGKSTWVRDRLAGTHAVVSKDHWPRARRREARQRRVVAELLAGGASVVVDNTHPSRADRESLIAAARAAGVPVRAVWVDTPFDVCAARNAARDGRARVPDVGMFATRARFEPPAIEEGFDRVEVVAHHPKVATRCSLGWGQRRRADLPATAGRRAVTCPAQPAAAAGSIPVRAAGHRRRERDEL